MSDSSRAILRVSENFGPNAKLQGGCVILYDMHTAKANRQRYVVANNSALTGKLYEVSSTSDLETAHQMFNERVRFWMTAMLDKGVSVDDV